VQANKDNKIKLINIQIYTVTFK